MKIIITLFLCAAAAHGAHLDSETRPLHSLPALEKIDDRDDIGQYTLKYITAEGTKVSETGHFIPTADGKDQVLVYEGEFEFVGDDGKVYVTKYKTDVVGHQPEGSHLPKPVDSEPVPDLIASA